MMPSLTFSPVQSWWVQLDRFTPPPAIRTLLRTASHQLRRAPTAPPFESTIRQRQDAVLASGLAGPHQLATIVREFSRGPVPTIVLGGFVPDASEAVFLLRDYLRRQGSLYCVNYPRHGFHLELLFAQLDDLVGEFTGVNLPGTDRERANWRRKLKGTIGGFAGSIAAFHMAGLC